MTDHFVLSAPQAVIGRQWNKSASTEQRQLLELARDALFFIFDTGQRHRFIAASNQYSAFREYLEHIAAGGPPYIVASFDTREEAESWLQNHPSPPDSANVLIANIYHEVVHERATGIRRLPRNRDLEYYLAEHQRVAPPTAVASFNSIEEAAAWLQSQPKPAPWAWVWAGGEFYLAAYYPNLGHRTLYPLSLARAVEPGESPQQ
jgi:hypothetical protein